VYQVGIGETLERDAERLLGKRCPSEPEQQKSREAGRYHLHFASLLALRVKPHLRHRQAAKLRGGTRRKHDNQVRLQKPKGLLSRSGFPT
jgi:hypothetical protein